MQYRLGDLGGWLLRVIPNEISTQSRQNIDLCFADEDKATRERIYRESLRHTCYTMAELGSIWCGPAEDILVRIEQRDICAEFERSKQGKLILLPHLGSWETLGLWLARYDNNWIGLYKRPKNKRLDAFITEARERNGGILVPTKKHGLRKILIGLKEGRSVVILPDQKPGKTKAQIASKFFGASAPTTTLVHSLCSKVECDVFIAVVYRTSPAGRFGLRIEPLEHSRLAANDIDSAQYMNDRIEQLVRQHVEQYQWGYRRFEAGVYASVK